MDHILGKVIEPKMHKTKEFSKYNKGEIRAQRILIESTKYYLIIFIADLGTSKAIYDKLVKLYAINTTGHKISLRN